MSYYPRFLPCKRPSKSRFNPPPWWESPLWETRLLIEVCPSINQAGSSIPTQIRSPHDRGCSSVQSVFVRGHPLRITRFELMVIFCYYGNSLLLNYYDVLGRTSFWYKIPTHLRFLPKTRSPLVASDRRFPPHKRTSKLGCILRGEGGVLSRGGYDDDDDDTAKHGKIHYSTIQWSTTQ